MEGSTHAKQRAASVVVVDYGLGNLRSVTRGLERAGAAVEITDDPDEFADSDGIVLPGVGAFREGVENADPYREALLDAAESGIPVFGICLGMQMLLTTSEEADHAGEGDVEGLDLIPGRNRRFEGDLKVPHMGWNELDVQRDHPLVEGIDGEHAYFVHSYYADPRTRTRWSPPPTTVTTSRASSPTSRGPSSAPSSTPRSRARPASESSGTSSTTVWTDKTEIESQELAHVGVPHVVVVHRVDWRAIFAARTC